MPLAGQWDFELNQGTDYTEPMLWSIGGSPVPMAGFSAKMQLKNSANSTEVVAEFNTLDSSITLNATTGVITFHKTPKQTSAIPAGVYLYDLKITDAAGVLSRLLEGKFTVNAEVTV
jgi:hypothetical protein